MKPKLQTKLGQPSWRLAVGPVELFVTQTGGHVGPVTFQVGDKRIQPYSVAPWAEEKTDSSLPPMLKALRGDFFCLPFGGNTAPFRGERHPAHGETANNRWTLESASAGDLHLSLRTKIRRGRVDKFISLREGHTAVYQRHVISGISGPMNPGHHAMLKFPDATGAGNISTSRFMRGDVVPVPVENPADRGYSCLKTGGTFRSLEKVPLQDGGWTDLSVYPARRGFEDIVMLTADARLPFAWTAVVFPHEGYVWFALKDPRVLRQTIFWLSNGGRHYPPWNGRHVNVLGLEEVTSCFHYGLAESAGKNPLSANGVPTCLQLNSKTPTVVNYIMAVAAIPKGFDHVAAIAPAADGRSVKLFSRSGKTTVAPLDLNFLGLHNIKLKTVS
jgi:hypothetical protein